MARQQRQVTSGDVAQGAATLNFRSEDRQSMIDADQAQHIRRN